MDIVRTGVERRRWIRRGTYSAVALIFVGGATLGLSHLKPALPQTDGSQVVDAVKRGLMLRQVHGSGTFVPEESLWIAAGADSHVERLPLQPGVIVKADTVIVELTDPALELEAVTAEWAAKSAEAQLTNQKAKLQDEQLSLEAVIAKDEAEWMEAKGLKQVDDELYKRELISKAETDLATLRVEQKARLIEIEKRQLDVKKQSLAAELAVQQAAVEQAKALYAMKLKQVALLKVRAGIDGVLEQVKVEVGQRIVAGTALAKVTNTHKLKAALKIPETEARDLTFGQKAEIDTRNSIVKGHVVRIDPRSLEGTVLVDVAIDEKLPREARPDMSLDGTIEIERLEDVLYVGRPVYGQADATVTLFKLLPDGTAARTRVKLGRSSVTTIEVTDGLVAGDRVILSDTREWDSFERIRVR